ncbi:C4-dicarboxylate ABC transporter [Rhodococcus kronopolitis]|uniref:C4-dicarboxylate ABC transporter n=1 Tax=Rhodococcus kronopolitis TaxID=1460226 RepID=A0ABV9FN15_9NOCA
MATTTLTAVRVPTVATDSTPFLARLTPNWFAVVMGTGIVAVGAAALPVHLPGHLVVARTFWLLAAAALLVLSVATGALWLLHREHALAHARNAATAPFFGAVAMGILTVGAGTLAAGADLIGDRPAAAIAMTLWLIGTAVGVVVAAVIPARMVTGTPTPAWLMPVVAPMVSASTGAALLSHLPSGPARLALLVACYALFVFALTAASAVLVTVIGHTRSHGLPALAAMPTVWIPLGVIGQSVAAANLLGRYAGDAVGPAVAADLHAFGVGYGRVVGGLGVLAFGLACVLTVHAANRGLRFTMSWWSFTFPIGTCAVGAGALSVATGSMATAWLSAALLALLVTVWCLVAAQTARGLWTGTLLGSASVPPVPPR